MRRSRWGFAPWLVLTCAGSSAWAAKRPFNIHDDILAYPQVCREPRDTISKSLRCGYTNASQYQVVFPHEYILDAQAEELLQTQASFEDREAIHVQNNPQVYKSKGDADGTIRDRDRLPFAYEEMVLDDRRLLCQIPRVTKDDLNTTSGQTDATDEQKELARATDRGLELLREMEGRCMYYFSGWWSYSFCYRKQIKQFHALPAGRGVPHYPPVEDPNTQSFILGQFPADSSDQSETEPEQKQTVKTEVAELHTKGGSRYLVQHLRGGTKCDLTGRDRRVEVQFHCHPQSTDQIGWIKELTTCSYLMVIYTPRLCDDVAFLPPQQDEVHNIECREILMPEDVPEWEAVKEWYGPHQLADAAAGQREVQIVGGIEVGGRKLVGMEGKQIEKGRVASAGDERVEVIAKRENGEVRRISKQVLKKYDLDPQRVEDVSNRLEEIASGKDWTLEVVENNGVIKFQGVVAEDVENEVDQNAAQGQHEQARDGPTSHTLQSGHTATTTSPVTVSQPSDDSDRDAEDGEGSEEIFKDEL